MMSFYQGQDLMVLLLMSSLSLFFFNTYWLRWVLVVAIFVAVCGILLVVACGIFSCKHLVAARGI